METEYICQNWKKIFEYPKTKDDMFVCPYCGSPDFEIITHK